jgi:hypothetical protein
MVIEIKLIEPQEALSFWNNSQQGSVFTHPHVLAKLSIKVDWWLAIKGKQPQCLWPVCLPDGNNVGLPDLTYYVGPFWSNQVYPLPAHRWLARSIEVYETFIESFLNKYDRIHACLPKGLNDVRAFDWWNYHDKNRPRFTIRPRYTAIISDLNNKSYKQIIADFRQLRRRELRNIEGFPPPPRAENWSTEDLIRLYLDVMNPEDMDITERNSKMIPILTDLVKSGFGEVVAFKDPSSEKIIAICLLLFGKSEANMALNLVDSNWRSSGLPALLITESINTSQMKGMSSFDFNGANSPNRGDDKHSYGALPALYFEIIFPGTTKP